MKNKKILIIVLIIIALVLISFLAIVLRNSIIRSKLDYISKVMEVNLNNCKIENDIDTHGGFLGDGDYFAKVICTEEIDNKIKTEWKELPLSQELQTVMDIIQCSGNGCNNVYNKYNIPEDMKGYYNFTDRHSDSEDRKNDEELNNRSSYNFSLGIYDSENKILYFYELDT